MSERAFGWRSKLLLKSRIKASFVSYIQRLHRVLTLSELPVHLSTQNVEEIARLCQVRHLHVAVLVLPIKFIWVGEDSRVFVAQLQISLRSSRRVLWALAVVPVRQRQNQTRSLHPFDLARRDKLINDALGIVRKISKLRFPDDQSIGRRERISVLETETRRLTGFFSRSGILTLRTR
jgi:hypothetical protein